MIEFMSSWIKGLGLAIVVVSILEMLLPNNKTKKYIRVVMGIYVLFTIISPFVNQKDLLKNSESFNLENYVETGASVEVDQSSMDERIKQLYVQELEKDIGKKLREKGYKVTSCKVKAKISDKEEETKINKIKIKVEKTEDTDKEDNKKEEDIEEKIISRHPKNQTN